MKFHIILFLIRRLSLNEHGIIFCCFIPRSVFLLNAVHICKTRNHVIEIFCFHFSIDPLEIYLKDEKWHRHIWLLKKWIKTKNEFKFVYICFLSSFKQSLKTHFIDCSFYTLIIGSEMSHERCFFSAFILYSKMHWVKLIWRAVFLNQIYFFLIRVSINKLLGTGHLLGTIFKIFDLSNIWKKKHTTDDQLDERIEVFRTIFESFWISCYFLLFTYNEHFAWFVLIFKNSMHSTNLG